MSQVSLTFDVREMEVVGVNNNSYPVEIVITLMFYQENSRLIAMSNGLESLLSRMEVERSQLIE